MESTASIKQKGQKETTPTPSRLKELRIELGYTQKQMAALAGYSDAKAWQKVENGSRSLSDLAHFHLCASLVLSDSDMQAIKKKMLGITQQNTDY